MNTIAPLPILSLSTFNIFFFNLTNFLFICAVISIYEGDNEYEKQIKEEIDLLYKTYVNDLFHML